MTRISLLECTQNDNTVVNCRALDGARSTRKTGSLDEIDEHVEFHAIPDQR